MDKYRAARNNYESVHSQIIKGNYVLGQQCTFEMWQNATVSLKVYLYDGFSSD